MAWTQRLPSGKHRALYRDADGKTRSAGTYTHKAEANRRAAEAEAKARRGLRINPAGHRMLWGDWADQWWPTRQVEKSSEKSAAAKMRTHVRPRWQDVRLGDITRLDVQRWVNELAEKRAASTVRQCYYLLSQSLAAAVAEGHLAVSPCTSIKLPTLPRSKERFLTRAEVDRILFHLDGVHRLLAEVLVGTGMRISEACGLHLDRLDLNRKEIEVVHVWDYAAGVMRPYTKNGKTRVVPISDYLADRLDVWLARFPASKTCGYPHDGDTCRSGLVLPSPRGRAIDPHNYTNRVWRRAVDAAEIGEARVHDLRHTYASWMLQSGISLERLRDLLGHGSVVTTERYGHLVPGQHDDVRAVLNGGRVAEGVAMEPRTAPNESGRDTATMDTKPLVGGGKRRHLRLISG